MCKFNKHRTHLRFAIGNLQLSIQSQITSRKSQIRLVVVLIAVLTVATGCTVHPEGEQAQRDAALRAGKPYQVPFAQRDIPSLPANAPPDDLVRHALLVNATLEQRYWEWRSAIEQIPQDGTQPTNLVLFAGVPITHGSTAFDRTTVTVANDPMNDILWPTKPTTAARRALENARAAGWRFQKEQFDLRGKVLDAWYDYARTAEMIRLEQGNADLLQTMARVTESRLTAGGASQQDLLKARNELDLSHNEIARLQAQLPARRAAINALLARDARAPLAVPNALPAPHTLNGNDDHILALAAGNNPELRALADEIQGRQDGIELAKLQYLPDFSASAATDFAGAAQNLMAMVTVPLLRYQAINAAIAQARANWRAAEAMQRQTANDLAARVVLDLSTVRDADRQLKLFQHTILPRARQTVGLSRTAYETGGASLLDLLDNQRSLIAIEKLVADLRVDREKHRIDLESAVALPLDKALSPSSR